MVQIHICQDDRCLIALFKVKHQQWEKLLYDLQLSKKCSLAFHSHMRRGSLHVLPPLCRGVFCLGGGWQRDLTSVKQKSSPWGFLEDASLTALKTADGRVTLLRQVFTISGCLWYENGDLGGQNRMPVLLHTEFCSKAFKTRT